MKLSNKELLNLKQKVKNNLENLENQRNLLIIGFNSGLYSYFEKLKKDFEIIEQSYSFDNISEMEIKQLSKQLQKLLFQTKDYENLLNRWIIQSRDVGIKQSDSFSDTLNISSEPLFTEFEKIGVPVAEAIFQKKYLLNKIDQYVENNTLKKKLPTQDNKKNEPLFGPFFKQLLNNSTPLISSLLVNRYINYGLYSNYSNNQNISYHVWITQHDQHVRPTHNAIDGEVVKIGEYFSNGCLYPCDKNGELSEIINCRCYTLPVPKDVIL